MTEEIFVLAKELTGAAAGEEKLLRILCAAAGQEVSDRLERETAPEICHCAAAWLAAASLMTSRAASGQDGGSWKVGDVSFTGGKNDVFAAAEALRQQAFRLLAGRDTGFVFRGVKG